MLTFNDWDKFKEIEHLFANFFNAGTKSSQVKRRPLQITGEHFAHG